MNDLDCAKEIVKWFGKILTKYDPIADSGKPIWNCNGDFFKFIGHDFFVNFITPFLREEKWAELKEILNTELLVGPTEHNRNERKESWSELSRHSPLLLDEGKKRRCISFHGDILKKMHEKEEWLELAPFKLFTETDFFLHLYGEKETQDKYYGQWYPRSDIWLNNTPRFLIEAVDYQTAIKICRALKINDIDELKKRLRGLQIRWDRLPPINEENIEKIGSEGGGTIITPS